MPSGHWAKSAIDYVARTHGWMRDAGAVTFRPEAHETRRLLARAIVRAFAPHAPAVPTQVFTDLDPTDPFYRFASVAVERGWMASFGGRFLPFSSVTPRQLHRGLVAALGLDQEMSGLNLIHTADGARLKHRPGFSALALGMVLGLRYNHRIETLDVLPETSLSRAEVAYSLWKSRLAATVDRWKLDALTAYRDVELPTMPASLRQAVEFGLRYVGYPYVWAGEWGGPSPSRYCCGVQQVGGFDCSGLMWWVMKAAGDGYDVSRLRAYPGWDLAERSSAAMAAGRHLSYAHAARGDLLFVDGNRDGAIDHVNLYLGNGWALDSSGGYGGVQVLRVGEGWYRDHFVSARRLIA